MVTKAEIKLVRSLADKSARDETGLFIAEGDKIVGEVLDSHFETERLYTTAKSAHSSGKPAQVVTAAEMERLSHLKTPPQSIALVRIPKYEFTFEMSGDRLILALDDVQDPGNLGTIIRLADWFGISDVICSRSTADCFNPKVIQATMGAVLRVRMHYADLPAMLSTLSKSGAPVYGTFLEGENIYDSALAASGVVVMGNEGKGISEAVSQYVTRKLYIPPYPTNCPTSESLNVATATAIICSEFRRRIK